MNMKSPWTLLGFLAFTGFTWSAFATPVPGPPVGQVFGVVPRLGGDLADSEPEGVGEPLDPDPPKALSRLGSATRIARRPEPRQRPGGARTRDLSAGQVAATRTNAQEEGDQDTGEALDQEALRQQMRRFEVAAFPREAAVTDPAPGVYGVEGGVASRPGTGAEDDLPPEALRSLDHRSVPTGTRGKGAGGAPPRAWLSKLRLPDLPVRWDPKVVRYLEYYRRNPRGRAIMRHWLRWRGRYRQLMERQLTEAGLPRALIYVAMIESGFNPARTSRVGAAGLWQFMPRTGRGLGMAQDYWVDERRNPRISTRGAIRYLRSLKARLGSWELALAAYNAGFGAVVEAAQKYNTNDYWQLCRYESGLPWSTTLYVPKVLAAAVVGENAERFGFGDVKPLAPWSHDKVTVPFSVTLKRAARMVGVSLDAMKALNPELRRGRTPPGTRTWLRVPRGKGDALYRGLRAWKGGAARYQPYVVRLGETPGTIAWRFGTSARALRGINGVKSAAELRPGLTILVPAVKPKAELAPPIRGKRAASRASDKGPGAEGEETLLVALPRGTPRRVRGRKRVFYRVVLGDTLAEVARHLKVTPRELASWNAVDPGAKLISTMVLQAFVPADFDEQSVVLLPASRVTALEAGSPAFLDAYERRKGRVRTTYRVRKGETLSKVAARTGLSVGSLCRINRIGRHTRLKPGERLVVYVKPGPPRRKHATRRRTHGARAKAAHKGRARSRRRRGKALAPVGAVSASVSKARKHHKPRSRGKKRRHTQHHPVKKKGR